MWVTALILDVFGSWDRPSSRHGSSGVRELTKVAIREDERPAGASRDLDHLADQNPMRAEPECLGDAAIESRERPVQNRRAGRDRTPGAPPKPIVAPRTVLAHDPARHLRLIVAP